MKKIGKLNINPEKVMKNEELISLRGGYDPTVNCCCRQGTTILICGTAHDASECEEMCSPDDYTFLG